MDALNPTPKILCSLGSLVIHIEEFLSEDGHIVDKLEMDKLLADPELREWLTEMDKLSFLPKKRKDRIDNDKE